MKTQSKNQIFKAVRELDPRLPETDESFHAAAVLLSALNVGPNRRRIQKILGYPEETVSRFFDNLERSGVFKNGKVYINEGVGFWIDVCVATGMFERSSRVKSTTYLDTSGMGGWPEGVPAMSKVSKVPEFESEQAVGAILSPSECQDSGKPEVTQATQWTRINL